ncbi:galactokinase [Georgenia yuyongxinii]|uniref:Galactokinase n=1 Tax=Georgenia yuyongxinii TaxID=2589797 RepID=A0A5B8C0T6_9MICO|nr:galactokinase [Georgenia yuyongxinii]QDC24048.1 galactokinase [Georgenia yuyongxinii]
MSRLLPAWSDDDGAARVRALFAESFAAEPDGVWAAPGRVNVIGEHTDYNGGLCLPIALPHRTFVALRARPGRTARLVSAQQPGLREVDLDAVAPAGTADAVQGWPAYAAGVAWALERDGLAPAGSLPGFDIAVDSCVPHGAGLSSSAALECAIAVALDDVAHLGLAADDAGRARLAAACVRAENEIAGAPTGGMDQAASLRARAGHALLLDCRDGSVEHVRLDLNAAGLALLVIDTRAPHRLVDGQYARRRAVCEDAARVLGVASLREVADAIMAGETTPDDVLARLSDEEQRRRVRHVESEIERVRFFVARLRDPNALRGWSLDKSAWALDASHESLREDYEVSSPELDLAVSAARAAGAHGARMTGGGFGGSAIALVDAERAEPVAVAVQEAFAGAGLRPPAFLLADAHGPAGRVDG